MLWGRVLIFHSKRYQRYDLHSGEKVLDKRNEKEIENEQAKSNGLQGDCGKRLQCGQ